MQSELLQLSEMETENIASDGGYIESGNYFRW